MTLAAASTERTRVDAEGALEKAAPSKAPPPRRAPAPGPGIVVIASVMAFSLMTAFFALFAFGLSGLQEHRSQQQLYELLRGRLDPSNPLAPPVRGDVPPGTPVALVNAPAAGLRNVVVVQGTSSGDLMAGPGHLRTSPLPGQIGESILVGKGSTAGAPFGGIGSLKRGDRVTVTTGQGTFHFVVLDERVAGARLPRLPSSGALLTLVTSVGSGVLGRLDPSHLVYVDAALHGKAVGSPGGTPQVVPPDELAGHGDPSAWPFVVLWIQALILASVALVYLWFRWGRWQSWLVGAPVMVGVLWALSTEVLRLLPNVY